MNLAQQAAFEAWLATRPVTVRVMAQKYPPGTAFNIHGQIMYVIAYQEDGGISVSRIDPGLAYDQSVAARQPICACCVHKLDSLVID